MKRLLVVSAAVWLIAMTAVLPVTAQNYPNLPQGMVEQEYRHVKVFSTSGPVSVLTIQKYSKVWEVLNRVVLRGRYAGAMPAPARIYFLTTEEARAIPAPYTIPPGYEFSGFYEKDYDGVVINGTLGFTASIVHELLHRLLSWLGGYNTSVYRTTGGYHPMMGVTQQQTTQSLSLQRAIVATPSVLTEARLNEIWQAVKGAEEFALWPVELVLAPHYPTVAGAYQNIYYPAWSERAEQRLAMSLASYIVQFFDRHNGAAGPVYDMVVNYITAIVEDECRAGCP